MDGFLAQLFSVGLSAVHRSKYATNYARLPNTAKGTLNRCRDNSIRVGRVALLYMSYKLAGAFNRNFDQVVLPPGRCSPVLTVCM